MTVVSTFAIEECFNCIAVLESRDVPMMIAIHPFSKAVVKGNTISLCLSGLRIETNFDVQSSGSIWISSTTTKRRHCFVFVEQPKISAANDFVFFSRRELKASLNSCHVQEDYLVLAIGLVTMFQRTYHSSPIAEIGTIQFIEGFFVNLVYYGFSYRVGGQDKPFLRGDVLKLPPKQHQDCYPCADERGDPILDIVARIHWQIPVRK